MEQKEINTNGEDGISLIELFDAAISEKWLILSIILLFTLAAGALSFVVSNRYTATVVLMPVSDNDGAQLGGGLSSLASQFGGLASLAGVSLKEDTKKSESVAVLTSEALTESYMQSHDLLPVLYASKWDKTTKRWLISDPEKIPTLWKANVYFKTKVRSIATDAKTGLVTLTIQWKNPKLAAVWANDLVKATNDYLRGKAIAQSERNIEYLRTTAAKTDEVGIKQAIYTILQSEISKQMLARGNDEYALKVIDPAVQPEIPSSPKRPLWIGFGLLGGLGISLMAVFLRTARRKSELQQAERK